MLWGSACEIEDPVESRYSYTTVRSTPHFTAGMDLPFPPTLVSAAHILRPGLWGCKWCVYAYGALRMYSVLRALYSLSTYKTDMLDWKAPSNNFTLNSSITVVTPNQ